jgi:hypothetical protein
MNPPHIPCLESITCISIAACTIVEKPNLFVIMVAKYTELQYNYCILGLSKMLLLVIAWSHLVGAQSNGDVRIVQNPNYAFIKHWGRLEVYINGE